MALLQTLNFLLILTLLLHLLWTMRALFETPFMRRAFFLLNLFFQIPINATRSSNIVDQLICPIG